MGWAVCKGLGLEVSWFTLRAIQRSRKGGLPTGKGLRNAFALLPSPPDPRLVKYGPQNAFLRRFRLAVIRFSGASFLTLGGWSLEGGKMAE